MASIYGLFDADDCLRYVGKANNPAQRLKSHMRENRRRTPLYDWIRKHGEPKLKVLEQDCSDWREAERRIIAEARAMGLPLLNVADGGDEPHCTRDVRVANANALNAKIHNGDPRERKIWELKRGVGHALARGGMSNAARAKLRSAAEKCPALFGAWRNLPDRPE